MSRGRNEAEMGTPDRIGIGLAALGRPAYITSGRSRDVGDATSVEMCARTAAVLDAAHACGVRYIDAARSYGRAEEFLALWLDLTPRGDRCRAWLVLKFEISTGWLRAISDRQAVRN